MEYYMNGKEFCGNKRCDKNCEKNITHVPRYKVCNVNFEWKPDKTGKCTHYEGMRKQ